MNLRIAILFFSALCCAYFNMGGQENDFSYTHFGKMDGLPSNTIYALCTDKNGVLWIGSDAGLTKFDGSKFTTYNTEDGLPSNEVFKLFCDSKNRLWIMTMGKKVTYFKNGKINNEANNELINKFDKENKIISVFEDIRKRVWLIFETGSVYIVDEKKIEHFNFNLIGGAAQILAEKGVYLFTGKNIIFYDYQKNKFQVASKIGKKVIYGIQAIGDTCYIVEEKDQLKKYHISCLYKNLFTSPVSYWRIFNNENSFWQLTSKGLISYKNYNLDNNVVFLKRFPTSSFTIDSSKNLWVSTLNSGIYKLNSKNITHNNHSQLAHENVIKSVFIEKKLLAFGSNRGEISLFHQRNKKEIIKLSESEYLSSRVLKIGIHQNSLLITTDNNFYTYSLKNKLLFKVFPDNQNTFKNGYFFNDTILLLSYNGIKFLNKNFHIIKEYLNNERFYSFCVYNNQKIFGSQTTLYIQKDSLEEYALDQPFHYFISDLKVQDSLLIAATTEKGIFFIHNHKIIRNVSLNDGLGTNNCAKVVPYKNDIYVATNNGIAIYNYQSKTVKKIMESDGLGSNNVLDMSIDQDTIYAGTDNGLSIIPIKELNLKSTFNFFINPIIEQKDTIWDRVKKIHTRSDHAMLLTLNAITLGVKGPVKYYYRIKELDTNFSLTLDPSVKLNIPSTGDYTFEAYATDVNLLKSVVTTLHIDVVPYWNQTWWFKLACLLAALATIYLFYKIIVHYTQLQEQKRSAEANRIHKLELDAWKSNINPHFLFNSFNTMQSLFSSSRFERANDFVANFSVVLRKTIDNSSRLMNSFDEEIVYLQNYLSLERYKKNNRMSYTLTVSDEKLRPYFLPSLLLQPIIENSIKHGIKQLRDGKVDVRFILNENDVTCIIQDNGIGLPEDGRDYTNSKGLKLVRDKMRIVENITGKPILFTIENKYNPLGQCKGVVATFTLPIFETNEYDEKEE